MLLGDVRHHAPRPAAPPLPAWLPPSTLALSFNPVLHPPGRGRVSYLGPPPPFSIGSKVRARICYFSPRAIPRGMTTNGPTAPRRVLLPLRACISNLGIVEPTCFQRSGATTVLL